MTECEFPPQLEWHDSVALSRRLSSAGRLLEVKNGVQQLPEELDLTDAEREVPEGDRDALTALADHLAIIGTPAGHTPSELDTDHAFIALTAVQSEGSATR